MRFVGVDLHKQTITVVVVDAARKLLFRKRFSNLMSEQIVAFLKSLGEFQLTVEATASYEWFVQSRRVCEVFGTHHARATILVCSALLHTPYVCGYSKSNPSRCGWADDPQSAG